MAPSTFSLCLLLLFSTALPHLVIPNRQDLKIKTRQVDGISATAETIYLKGTRERREITQDAPIKLRYIGISQCDQKRCITLNDEAKV